MSDATDIKTALATLARHLAARRAVILANWQRSVEADPELTTFSSLSRAQFNDHVPQVLAAFERRLQARDPIETCRHHFARRECARADQTGQLTRGREGDRGVAQG